MSIKTNFATNHIALPGVNGKAIRELSKKAIIETFKDIIPESRMDQFVASLSKLNKLMAEDSKNIFKNSDAHLVSAFIEPKTNKEISFILGSQLNGQVSKVVNVEELNNNPEIFMDLYNSNIGKLGLIEKVKEAELEKSI